jgi:hypothetical protein
MFKKAKLFRPILKRIDHVHRTTQFKEAFKNSPVNKSGSQIVRDGGSVRQQTSPEFDQIMKAQMHNHPSSAQKRHSSTITQMMNDMQSKPKKDVPKSLFQKRLSELIAENKKKENNRKAKVSNLSDEQLKSLLDKMDRLNQLLND